MPIFPNRRNVLGRRGAQRALLAFASLVACWLLPALSARADIGSFVVVDAGTGAVMDQKNATRPWYPASLTKMMTAYITFKAVRQGRARMDSIVVQSANSRAEPPSKLGLKVGTRFTVETALKIILVKSANDIAVALGEAIGGSESTFIDMMNAEAQRLGMRDTHFVNPHGLPDNRQVTSARDMAILALALRRDFPESRDYYKLSALQYGSKTLRSANREFLVRVPGADGMKTGYICNSGYNVAATATRRGRTILVVVLGAASGLERAAFARSALDDAFRKRSGGRSLESLGPAKGSLPPDGYCRSNPKPGLKGLVASYDMGGGKKGFGASALSFASSKPGGIVMPVIGRGSGSKPGKADLKEFKLSNGKTDWKKVLDRTLGPVQRDYATLQISMGVPNGAQPPRASQWVAGLLPEVIPLPARHPGHGTVVTQAAQATQATEDEDLPVLTAPARAPGSLFTPNSGSGVPVPKP